MPLQTRKPTGRVAFPFILVEGEEKAGKSFMLAQFAASPRVGRCFYLDLGDGTLDEYARLGDYDLLVHDGTWSSIIDQVRAAAAEPSDPEKPNVIGIDSGSDLWMMLKLWTDARARNSKKGRETLQKDPDAEVDAPMNLWNDSKGRWAELLGILKGFPGIGVMLAQGSEVTKVENGAPTKETVWTIEAEKTTAGKANAWVRIKRPHSASLIGVRSLDIHVPDGGLPLPDSDVLDHLVFEIIGAGKEFGESQAVSAKVGVPVAHAKGRVLSAVKGQGGNLSEDEAKAEAGRIWAAFKLPNGKDAEITPDTLTETLLAIAEGRVPGDAQDAQEGEGDAGAGDPVDPPETKPQGPGGTSETAQSEGDPPEAMDAADQEDQETPPEAPETPTEGSAVLVVEGRTLDDREAVFYLDDAKGQELQAVARSFDLPVSGRVDEIRARILDHLGLDRQEVIEADRPEVPDGWVEESSCLCGEPTMYEVGKYETLRHVDPALDEAHKADVPF